VSAPTGLLAWFDALQTCVRAVDFASAERLFAPDVMGFGTYKDIAVGREELRAAQWSNIWPTITDFTFRLDRLHWGMDGKLAWAACPWDSTGYGPDGAAFYRPGRVTVIFDCGADAWLALHTHFSLYPRPANAD
jgi:ketosteroid isomerase-like protein